MAQHNDDKEALIAELERARSRMTAHCWELGHDVDVPTKLKASISGHRAVWLSVAGVFGLLMTQLLFRRKKVVVEPKRSRKKEVERAGVAGLLLGVLRLLVPVVKPMIMTWVTQRMRHGSRQQRRKRAKAGCAAEPVLRARACACLRRAGFPKSS